MKRYFLIVVALGLWIVLGFGVSFRSNDQLCSPYASRDVYLWGVRFVDRTPPCTSDPCSRVSCDGFAARYGFPVPFYTTEGSFGYLEPVHWPWAVVGSLFNLIFWMGVVHFVGLIISKLKRSPRTPE